ncbi:MAG: thioredoxin family protein [Planctomycetes bacterium]|nr:thioredoxin family protein [Planctomycetota bacterium]
MARTPSVMVALGTPAPAFALPDPRTGKTVCLADFAGKRAFLVMFICNHCPYVKHIAAGLTQLGKDYEESDAALVAINANDAVAYPDDAPDKMAEEARARDYRFPYLFDATQEVARAHGAACTPDFFVYDAARRLVYRGQFDASRRDTPIPVTGGDVRAALTAVLAGRAPAAAQFPSLGCNVKWREA